MPSAWLLSCGACAHTGTAWGGPSCREAGALGALCGGEEPAPDAAASRAPHAHRGPRAHVRLPPPRPLPPPHGRCPASIGEEPAALGGQSRQPARGGVNDAWAQDPVGTRPWTGQQAARGTEVAAVGAGGGSLRWGASGGRRGLSFVPALLGDGTGERGPDGRPRRPAKAEGRASPGCRAGGGPEATATL